MPITTTDWKSPYRRALEESIRFFGNESKFKREKWVVDRLLTALGVPFEDDDLVEAAEPVDVVFRDARFQVKELMESNRRRSDELRDKLEKLEKASSESDLLESYSPKDILFSDIADNAMEKARNLAQVKYGPTECASLDLLCYFNWLDYGVIPSIGFPSNDVNFRSVSVVSNIYCAVLFAAISAPEFLRLNQGSVFSGSSV